MKKVILAGNYQQFMDWCRETKTNPRECVYYDHPHKILGLSHFEQIKVGTWSDVKDAYKLVSEA